MTRNTEDDTVVVLTQHVEDAARLRLHLLGWESDQRFAASGGRIIYSIDTDILKLFLDPVNEAVSHRASGKDPRPGYTQIFRGDPPELSIALGRALGEFIFFRLGERAPLLMLPPIEREVGGMFQAITLNADREHRDALGELHRLRENLSDLVERIRSISDYAERLNLVIGEMPRLHDLLFGYSGPSAELARLAILLEKSPLTDLDHFLSAPHGLDAVGVEHLRRPISIRDWIDFSHLQGRWEERIAPLKSKRMSRKNIETDCRVLARVELLDRILKPLDVRVVHVTGDQAIFGAASGYRPDEGGPSFDTLYLRDPRAFFAEPSVLFTEHDTDLHDAQELIEWLDVFLAEFTDNEEISSAGLPAFLERTPAERHNAVEQVLRRDPLAGSSFANRWKRFCGPVTLDLVRSASKKHSASVEQYLSILSGWAEGAAREPHREFREADSSFRQTMRHFQETLDDLDALVTERVLETWRGCFAAATSTGFSLLQFGAGDGPPARSPLPITFGTFQAASDFFSEMLRGGHGERYREMIEALWIDDDTDYVFYLAFGALFGARGKWRVALILADRALAVVEKESSGPRPEKISGREAYYLRAAARRLTARDRHDFDEAEGALRHARAALERNRAAAPDHPITGLRFDAEQVAIDLGRYLFDLFSGSPTAQPPSPELPGALRDRIPALLERIDRELEDDNVRERVRRALLVNHLTCLILGARTPSGVFHHVEIRDGDRSIFDDLKRRMTGQEGARIEQSYLHQFALLAARALFEPPRSKAELRERRTELERHSQEARITGNLVTAYDRRRFEFMRGFAMRTLAERHRQYEHSIER